MTKALEEKAKKCYPCGIHHYTETVKTYDSDDGKYLVTCPICGIIGRITK